MIPYVRVIVVGVLRWNDIEGVGVSYTNWGVQIALPKPYAVTTLEEHEAQYRTKKDMMRALVLPRGSKYPIFEVSGPKYH